MAFYYNPLDKRFKSVIGAVKENEEFSVRVITDGTSCILTIKNDDGGITDYRLENNGDGSFLLPVSLKKGLYFYRFNVDGVNYFKGKDFNAEATGDNGEWYQLLVYDADYKTPEWLSGGVIYQIFPDRFCKAGNPAARKNYGSLKAWGEMPEFKPDKNGKILNDDFFCGNLKGIESKLSYLKELNVNAIYLNPITLSHSNHRYDTSDYFKIDDYLGTDEDFASLCRSAAKLGISVIIDGVYNHTGDDSVYFNKYNRFPSVGAYQSKKSKYYNWYTFEKFPDKYACWWGIDVLPTINKNSFEFEDFIAGENGVLEHYLKLGANGVRLDVVDELPPDFVKKIRTRVKAVKPDAVIIGEVWEDATNKIAYGKRRKYFQGSQLDSVMNYPLKNAIIGYLKEKNADILKQTVENQLNNYPESALRILMNILGTHDTPRVLTVLGRDKEPTSRDEAAKSILTAAEREKATALLKLAVVLQFTLYGVPSVYYGDEEGMEGEKDPFNRKCFDWNNADKDVYDFYKKISSIRLSYNVFKNGETKILLSEGGVFIFERRMENSVITVAVNAGEYVYEISSNETLYNPFSGSCGNKFELEKNTFLILTWHNA